MRAVYRERIRERLRRGHFLWLARQAWRYAGIRLSRPLNRPLTGPILGTLVVSYGCNLRCRMCDLPLRVSRYADEGLDPLSTAQLLEVIDDFAAIGTLGLGFTGGEPLMRRDIFEMLERSRRAGMITHLNTNGALLTGEAIDRILAIGVDSLNLSLDGSTPQTHDRIRAAPGSFEQVLDALGRLRDRRASNGSAIRIKLVCVLSRENLHEAEKLIALRREVGADAIDFIPVHDFDQPGSSRKAEILEPAGPDVIEEAAALARRLEELSRHEPIENSPAHLDLIARALAGEPSPVRCFAGFNSLVVDGYGRIFPCVPWSNMDRMVGSVRTTPLRRFWSSREYAAARKELRQCRDCYLNCQTELNLLFDRPLGRALGPRPRRSASSRSGSA